MGSKSKIATHFSFLTLYFLFSILQHFHCLLNGIVIRILYFKITFSAPELVRYIGFDISFQYCFLCRFDIADVDGVLLREQQEVYIHVGSPRTAEGLLASGFHFRTFAAQSKEA